MGRSPRRGLTALWQVLAIVWQEFAILWRKLAILWQRFAIMVFFMQFGETAREPLALHIFF